MSRDGAREAVGATTVAMSGRGRASAPAWRDARREVCVVPDATPTMEGKLVRRASTIAASQPVVRPDLNPPNSPTASARGRSLTGVRSPASEPGERPVADESRSRSGTSPVVTWQLPVVSRAASPRSPTGARAAPPTSSRRCPPARRNPVSRQRSMPPGPRLTAALSGWSPTGSCGSSRSSWPATQARRGIRPGA